MTSRLANAVAEDPEGTLVRETDDRLHAFSEVWAPGCMKPDRTPDVVIGDLARPYLLRWWLIPRNPLFNIYYHRVLRDDDDRALHDHPWPSVSVIVSGVIWEILPESSRLLAEGEAVYRPPGLAHRLELLEGMPAETLFITGPKLREWGFHCPEGWLHWRDFEAAGGCGEDETS